jgi:D-3-phosphoglycerate dehydrogenase
MRVLLLENIHPESVKIFSSSSLAQDCKVESFKKSLSEDELIKELESNLEKKEGKEEEKEKEEENDKKQVVIGIRSVTKLSSQIINNSSCSGLRAIGCYSIGFDGVDLRAASLKGIPVFNSQFSSTHSVAELIIAQIINLARRIGDNIFKMRSGQWEKSAENKIEIRGQTLGIVGYGHIGSTVGILASSLGMNVVFYDIVPKLAYGNAKQVSTLQECLSSSNFVTLHVTGGGSRPLAPQSLIGKNSGDKDRKGVDDKDMKEEKKDEKKVKNNYPSGGLGAGSASTTFGMINSETIAMMKPDSYLLNASRGTVVVIKDIIDALKTKHLAGFYADVFLHEPKHNGNWLTPVSSTSSNLSEMLAPTKELKELAELSTLSNVILTSHIGGSTEQAQKAIAIDVSRKIVDFLTTGSTLGSVNLPQISLPQLSLPTDTKEGKTKKYWRVCNFHKNVPRVLLGVYECLSKFNICGQNFLTLNDIGYCIIDIEGEGEGDGDREKAEKELKKAIEKINLLSSTIKTFIANSFLKK